MSPSYPVVIGSGVKLPLKLVLYFLLYSGIQNGGCSPDWIGLGLRPL